MSKDDNLTSNPTIYKGIQMRSKLESRIAFFLDLLKIKWEYEPNSFLLSDGTSYIPDFYLTEMDIWLEVKGVICENNIEISKKFVKENKTTLLMISNIDTMWFSLEDFDDGINVDFNIYIGLCSHCNKYFFCSNLGDWGCKNCGSHEGDHDLKYTFNSDEMISGDKINFYDIDSIIDYLKNNCDIKIGVTNGDSI